MTKIQVSMPPPNEDFFGDRRKSLLFRSILIVKLRFSAIDPGQPEPRTINIDRFRADQRSSPNEKIKVCIAPPNEHDAE